jgi:hypothetical protein
VACKRTGELEIGQETRRDETGLASWARTDQDKTRQSKASQDKAFFFFFSLSAVNTFLAFLSHSPAHNRKRPPRIYYQGGISKQK